MGLFEKKFCDICGEKISLLGNRKLEDGNICKDCANKLSPFFSERKKSTLEEIKQQLAYREQNKQNLASFNATRTIGNEWKVIIDDNQRKFVVTRKNDFRAENADIIDISAVNNVRYEVDEDRTERYQTDSEGNRRSYNPPQYDYDYDIKMYIFVNHPYFNEIEFQINPSSCDSRYSEEFRRYEQIANEMVMALGGNPMGGNMGGGFQQPMNGGYQQQNMGYQQPMQGGYQQQNNMGYQQQQPMNAGYQQQNMGYQQQQPMNGGYQQQNNMGYQQPMQQQPMQQGGFQQGAAAGGQWFCQNCGTPNTTNFCQNCGKPRG